MTGVLVGHSASCVMCLVDTMWVPLVVSLSSLFKKAFSYTRGAGFAQVRGERGPTTWLGLLTGGTSAEVLVDRAQRDRL